MDYSPLTDLRYYPGYGPEAMLRYGANAFNQPLYRIVFADSRKHIVQGTWADGSVGAKWRPKYRPLAGMWIMERWMSAERYHGMTREKWDSLYSALPYQERGEYDHCHTFETCDPVNANIDKLVRWIEAGSMGSYQDNLDSCRREYDLEEKDKANEIEARIRNVLPAFGTAPLVGFGGGRGTKTARVVKSANELGLPMGGAPKSPVETSHKLFGGKKKVAYEVPVKVA